MFLSQYAGLLLDFEQLITYSILYGQGVLDCLQPPSLNTTLYRQSTTVYSIIWQPLSILGVLLLNPQPEDASFRGEETEIFSVIKTNLRLSRVKVLRGCLCFGRQRHTRAE